MKCFSLVSCYKWKFKKSTDATYNNNILMKKLRDKHPSGRQMFRVIYTTWNEFNANRIFKMFSSIRQGFDQKSSLLKLKKKFNIWNDRRFR